MSANIEFNHVETVIIKAIVAISNQLTERYKNKNTSIRSPGPMLLADRYLGHKLLRNIRPREPLSLLVQEELFPEIRFKLLGQISKRLKDANVKAVVVIKRNISKQNGTTCQNSFNIEVRLMNSKYLTIQVIASQSISQYLTSAKYNFDTLLYDPVSLSWHVTPNSYNLTHKLTTKIDLAFACVPATWLSPVNMLRAIEYHIDLGVPFSDSMTRIYKDHARDIFGHVSYVQLSSIYDAMLISDVHQSGVNQKAISAIIKYGCLPCDMVQLNEACVTDDMICETVWQISSIYDIKYKDRRCVVGRSLLVLMESVVKLNLMAMEKSRRIGENEEDEDGYKEMTKELKKKELSNCEAIIKVFVYKYMQTKFLLEFKVKYIKYQETLHDLILYDSIIHHKTLYEFTLKEPFLAMILMIAVFGVEPYCSLAS